MTHSRAEILADTAKRIADFPKYYRRDLGGVAVVPWIKLMLEPYGLSGNEALVADIEAFTDRLRETMQKYFVSQFLEPMP
jgi:hypothetical protein